MKLYTTLFAPPTTPQEQEARAMGFIVGFIVGFLAAIALSLVLQSSEWGANSTEGTVKWVQILANTSHLNLMGALA